jgi:uncharacterized protein YecE (DUF72 family)
MPRKAPRATPTPKGAVTAAGVLRIGTQGWNYTAWSGPFYPPETRPPDFLTIYARAFDTVEVDSTFYAAPSLSTVQGWASRVPSPFVFALKMPQEITHERHLRDVAAPTGEFFDRVRALGRHLGPVLVQFGPDFGPGELPAFAAFLPLLPRDVRVAVEFRHRGWVHDGVLALLAQHNIALALTDARFIPLKTTLALAERPTADFAYVRWLGASRDLVDHSRVQVDRSRETEAWATAVRTLATRVGTVYGYMSNQFAGHAPASARAFQTALGQRPVPPEHLGDQLSLF